MTPGYGTDVMDKRPVLIIDNNDELRSSLEQALHATGQPVIPRDGDEAFRRYRTDRTFLEFPSDLALLELITGYATKRIEQAWSAPEGYCRALTIALSESLINAIKHGNKSDASKLVRFTIEILNDEARFIVEDEGPGFDVHAVANPRDSENLFRPSGRGVLLIKSIMDSAKYNDRGNRLTMTMRRASLLNDEVVSARPSHDKGLS